VRKGTISSVGGHLARKGGYPAVVKEVLCFGVKSPELGGGRTLKSTKETPVVVIR